MGVRGTFQSKDPAEKISLPFDFTADLGTETITGSPSVDFTLDAGDEGTDPTLATNGSPVVDGGVVYVPVQNGVHQVDYVVGCTVTTSGGRVLRLAGLLPVRDA